LILLYNHGSLFENIDPTKTADKNNLGLTIFAIITFTLLAIAFVIVLLPSFENVEKLFGQMQKTIYVVLYTIFLILLFRLIPNDTLNNYAYLITPITLLGAIFVFSQALNTNYITEFNINYERIKMIVLFFLVTSFI
jgi:hypothetical protein